MVVLKEVLPWFTLVSHEDAIKGTGWERSTFVQRHHFKFHNKIKGLEGLNATWTVNILNRIRWNEVPRPWSHPSGSTGTPASVLLLILYRQDVLLGTTDEPRPSQSETSIRKSDWSCRKCNGIIRVSMTLACVTSVPILPEEVCSRILKKMSDFFVICYNKTF